MWFLFSFSLLFYAALTRFPDGSLGQTLQYDITTMAVNGTFSNETDECFCECDDDPANQAPATVEEAEVAAAKITKALTLNKTSLSSTTRKKISAPDSRPSAQGMGFVGVLVIVFVLGSIIALDFSTLARDLKITINKLLGANTPAWIKVARGGKGGVGGDGHGGTAGGPQHMYTPFQPDDVGALATQSAAAAALTPGMPKTDATSSTFTQENEGDSGGQVKGQGHDAGSMMAAPALPPPTLSTSGVQDIKSRRELLMQHGGTRR